MIRVLLAEDEELIREALAGLLGREPDLDVVAAVGDGRAALAAALAHRPDVAVVDLQMPGLDGLGVVAELARIAPDCRAVILTGHGGAVALRAALTSGARAFLAKGAPGGALADVVRRVHAGGRYVDPVLAADALTLPASPLTDRETAVLAAAGEDRPVREVARRLHLSPGTVRNHLSAAARKLGVHGRAAAWRRAHEQGWV